MHRIRSNAVRAVEVTSLTNPGRDGATLRLRRAGQRRPLLANSLSAGHRTLHFTGRGHSIRACFVVELTWTPAYDGQPQAARGKSRASTETDEQRSQPGCIVGRLPRDFCHGLPGRPQSRRIDAGTSRFREGCVRCGANSPYSLAHTHTRLDSLRVTLRSRGR